MWIKHVAYEDATGRLKMLYDRVKGPENNVDNIMLAHSLRPHTMEGHMALYKYVLHHASNTTPKWFLETIGVYVSLLNACAYCVEHHFSGLKRLLMDDARANLIRGALETDPTKTQDLDLRQRAALKYAFTLTKEISADQKLLANVEEMRTVGWNDESILEINQVVAYFNYANRTVLGLGVNTQGDILGLSPGNSDDAGDWAHR